MDYFKDLCVDFFDYVCGGWIKVNLIFKSLFIYFIFVKLNGYVECNLRYILEKGISVFNKKLFYLLKWFYELCMDLNIIEKLGDKLFWDFVDRIGGWIINSILSWNEKDWSFERILLEIYKNYIFVGGLLFFVYISDDFINNIRYIIEVRVV